MKRLIIASCLAAAGCGGAQSGAEKVVRQALKDPDSARFGDFYYNEKTKRGCLAVNAKNSLGGYTGDQQAWVELTESGWVSHAVAQVSAETCRTAFADAG